jgi:hypothetical protein
MGFRVTEDRHYEQQRNALIPRAAEKADKTFGVKAPGGHFTNERYAVGWTGCFMAEMDRLAEERGLCVPFGKMIKEAI